MDGAAEFQVSAQADGKMIKASFQGADGKEIRKGLGGMLVSAVAGIDDRN